MTGIRSTNNNDCDTFNSCDTTCTSSNNYLQTSSYKQTFSLPEVSDTSAPSWSQSPVLTFSNTFSRSITVGLECYDDDGIGKEGPWSKTVTHNNIDGSAAGKKSSELQFGSLGPYYTNFYYYMTVKCSTNYFNTQCSEFCQAGSPSVCTGCDANTGYCTCSVGYTGKDCESCATNYYPYSSSCRYCLANSGGCYGCDATGARTCCASHRAPDCTALKDCGPFPAVPANAEKLVDDNYLGSGLQVCKNTTYDSYCIYRCKSGYSGGNVQIQCPASEVWPTPTLNCVDINECQTGTHNCNQNCQNTDGDYTCSCNSGFYKNGDGRGPGGCININECSLSDKGGCEQVCNDTIGSYFCTCNSGYQLNGDGKTCRNINECTEGGNNCSPNAFCNDTIGSFYCTCKPGYSGNGVTCNDIDECLTTPCDPNASCQNLPGSFKCTCSVGYRGDGFTCIPSGAVNFDESSRTVVAKEGDSITLLVNAVVERDDCSVQFSITGTAASGTDYLLLNSDHTLAFTTSTNQTTISFFISDDSVPEELETITVTITDPVRMVLGSHIVSTIYIEANDNPYGVVQIKNGSRAFSVNMGVPTYSLVVERVLFTNKNYNAVVSIQGFHPSSSNFSVTIPVNQTEATLTIPLPFSTTPSLAALYNFTITGITCGAACGSSSPFIGYYKSSTVTINEHDDPYGVFGFISNTFTLPEGGVLVLSALRTQGAFGTVTVRVRTFPLSIADTNGVALADASDFVALDTQIVFNAGETEKSFSVAVVDDNIPELTEMFGLTMTIVSGNGRLSTTQSLAKFTIPENDDARGVLSVTPLGCFPESGAISNVIAIEVKRTRGLFGVVRFQWSTVAGNYTNNSSLSIDNVAIANQDFVNVNGEFATINEGESGIILYVQILNDEVPELDEYFNVVIFNVTGARLDTDFDHTNICITQNDNPFGVLGFASPVLTIGPNNDRRLLVEEGNTLTLTINRYFGTFRSVAGVVTLTHNTTNSNDFISFATTKSFQFVAGQSTATVSWDIRANDGDEPAEFFSVTLTAQPAGAGLEAVTIRNTTALDSTIQCAIEANNAEFGVVRFVKSQYIANEDDGAVTLTIERIATNPTDVSCNYLAVPLTASGDDFDASNDNNHLFLSSNETTTNFTITITNDGIPEGDETFSVSLTNFTGGAQVAFASYAIVTIAANDNGQGVFVFGPTSESPNNVITVVEDFGYFTFNVLRTVAQYTDASVTVFFTTSILADPYLISHFSNYSSFATANFATDLNMTSTQQVLQFPEGKSSAEVTVNLINDNVSEYTKVFFILLKSPTNGAILGTNKAIAVVLKDDEPAPVSGSSSIVGIAAGVPIGLILLLLLVLLIVFARRRRRARKTNNPEFYKERSSTLGQHGLEMNPLYDQAGGQAGSQAVLTSSNYDRLQIATNPGTYDVLGSQTGVYDNAAGSRATYDNIGVYRTTGPKSSNGASGASTSAGDGTYDNLGGGSNASVYANAGALNPPTSNTSTGEYDAPVFRANGGRSATDALPSVPGRGSLTGTYAALDLSNLDSRTPTSPTPDGTGIYDNQTNFGEVLLSKQAEALEGYDAVGKPLSMSPPVYEQTRSPPPAAPTSTTSEYSSVMAIRHHD